MKKITDLLGEKFKAAFEKCGYDEKYGAVTVSNRPDLCQFQCNGAMACAKAYKKAPFVIAGEVCESVVLDGIATATAIAPGFINIILYDDYLAGYIREMGKSEKFGYERSSKPKTVIVDYGGANVAKPLHIGHLRPAVIGEAVKRICKYAGDNVIGDVHLGDWGLQIGQIIEELRDRKPELCYFDENYTGEYPSEAPFDITELEEIYPTASGKSKKDEVFKKRAQEATRRLQEGYAPFRAIWRHILNVSIADLRKNYDNLNVSFELWLGESDADPYIEDMINDMVNKGFAHESQGALVVDIAEEGDTKDYPPCIIRKSDGAALYETTDLATIVQREKDYQPDKYIYVVDKRQDLHFLQVFRAAKKCGLTPADRDLQFIGFGTVNGKDGKPFKTRDGGVMRLENLISGINDEVYKKIMDGREMDEKDAREIAAKVGLAALKYADLSNQATKDYIFEPEKFTSFEGNTGPYILYTMVRIKSILAKAKENSETAADYIGDRIYTKSETDLMLALSRFSDMIERSYEETAPHKMCQYIYDLANAFNGFYHENKIMSEPDLKKKAEWIELIGTVLAILETCIDILGFEAPDRM